MLLQLFLWLDLKEFSYHLTGVDLEVLNEVPLYMSPQLIFVGRGLRDINTKEVLVLP